MASIYTGYETAATCAPWSPITSYWGAGTATTSYPYTNSYAACAGSATSTSVWVMNSAGQWNAQTVMIPWATTCWGTPSLAASPQLQLREIIRARQAPMHLPSHRKLVLPTQDARELRARATMRRIIGESNWRSYRTRGFVSVRGKSGLVYQIFAGHEISRVYRDGAMIERLCIVLSGDYPPTDALLARYVMILSDEAGFRKLAIRHGIYAEPSRTVAFQPDRSLVDEWRRIRRAS